MSVKVLCRNHQTGSHRTAFCLTTLFAALCFCITVRGDEYDILREKWFELLVGPISFSINSSIQTKLDSLVLPVASNGKTRDTESGTGYWDTLDTSPGRTYLWSDLASASESSHITACYKRLEQMALAYATYGSELLGDTDLRDDIIGAVDWLYRNRYNEETAFFGNWWDWDIGIPTSLNNILIVMYSDLPPKKRRDYIRAIDKFSPTPHATIAANPMTGANLTWKCMIVALSGIIEKNGSKIGSAASGLSPIFKYATSGDGFHTDGSFLQHSKHAYNAGYGAALIHDILDLIYLLDGSTWEVDDPDANNVYTWLHDSFEPIIYKGEAMDSVRGRGISRYNLSSHEDGHIIMGAYLRATQVAAPSDADYLKSTVKYWINTDTTYEDPYKDIALYDTLLAQSIIADSDITERGALNAHYSFPGMARSVHRSKGWAVSLAMHSTRIATYEKVNNENLAGWYTGSGTLYLYNDDLNRYSDNYWPTVNAYRLPGTTVEAGFAQPVGFSLADFVGGVESYDTAYGVAAMDLWPTNRTLRGRKSWFFFDNEVVCLGTGITARDGYTLETIVMNSKLNEDGDNLYQINGTPRLVTLQTMPGSPGSISGASYAHLEGNVSGSDIGYYFPGGQALKGMREKRTGAWSDINQGPIRKLNTTEHTRSYVQVWYDHGIDPPAASYVYAILPGISAAGVASYASSPDFSVLENSDEAQAVKEKGTGTNIGAIFWGNTKKTVGTGGDAITSMNEAAVFTQYNSSSLFVTVADPTQSNTGYIELEFGRSATSVASSDHSIEILQLSPTIRIRVNVDATYGQEQKVEFKLEGRGKGTADTKRDRPSNG